MSIRSETPLAAALHGASQPVATLRHATQYPTSLADADWENIPDHLRYGMRAYVERGRVPGAFLTAVLINDGHEMVTRAPKLTLAELRAIVGFCDRYLPRECFGTPERVADWEDLGGLAGLRQIAETGVLAR